MDRTPTYLEVKNASAGSGKTTLLVNKFLTLLLKNKNHPKIQDKDKYKSILAVTFTNKAAAEMKNRIINSLIHLSDINNNQDKDIVKYHLMEIKNLTQLNENEIEIRAQRCLSNILHDYSNFSISTIDSFSFRIIKSFAYYLGVNDSVEPYLDFNGLIEKAVNNLFLKLGENKLLTDFLLEKYIYFINDNEKNFNSIKTSLLDIGYLLGNDSISENLRKGYIQNNLNTDLQEAITFIKNKILELENAIKKQTNKAIKIIKNKGLEVDDFKGKGSGILGKLEKFKKNNYDINKLEHSKRTESLLDYNNYSNDDEEKYSGWLNKPSSEIIDVESFSKELYELVNNIFRIKSELMEYNMIYSNLYPLTLLKQIDEEIEIIKENENILPVGEFNRKISEVVSKSHAPFIYERIGNRFENIMIDEFQDTSKLQWGNLSPLVDNSRAQGQENLIVGDAKQAIYRWRDGDVKQFIDLQKEFPSNLDENSTNYRSCYNIIEFNNQLFTFLGNSLCDGYKEKVYSKNLVYQNIPNNKPKGYVNIKFLKKDDYNTSTCRTVYNTIVDLVENKGYKYSDITIIVRTAKNGRDIANYIIEQNNNIKIISADSLLLKSSEQITTLVSFFKIIGNLSDKKDIYNVISFIGNNKNISFNNFIYKNIPKNDSHNNKNDSHNNKIDSHKNILIKFLKENDLNFDINNLNKLSPLEICNNALKNFDMDMDIYVNSLLNVIQKNNNLSLTDLISLLDDELKNSSITLSKSENALQIMTIHKAKGLEFPIVIFPFTDNIDSTKGKKGKLFLENKVLDIKEKLPYVLINKKDDLQDTIFKDDYNDEIEKDKLDNINLFYVACTRATNALFILGKELSDNKIKYISKHQENSIQFGDMKFSLNDNLFTFCKYGVNTESIEIKEINKLNNATNLDESEKDIDDLFCEFEIGKNTLLASDNLKNSKGPDNFLEKNLDKNDSISINKNNKNNILKNYANNWNNKLLVAISIEHLMLINDIKHFLGENYEKYFGDISKNKKHTPPTDETIYGNQLHNILSKIKTKDDLQYYIDNLEEEPYRIVKNNQIIKDTLYSILNDEILCTTLFEYNKLYIEKDMSDADGNLYRADRILVKDGKTLVIDFKTGKENARQHKEYQKQINKYCDILKQVGFHNVEGKIIYL